MKAIEVRLSNDSVKKLVAVATLMSDAAVDLLEEILANQEISDIKEWGDEPATCCVECGKILCPQCHKCSNGCTQLKTAKVKK